MLVTKFETEEGITILRLGGKLIASTLDDLKASLGAALSLENPIVLLNFTDVKALDTFVVGLIVSRLKQTERKKGIFALCGMTPAMLRLFNDSGSDKPVEASETEEEAIALIQSRLKALD